MKKFATAAIIQVLLMVSSLQALSIRLSTDKTDYLRYEIVRIYCAEDSPLKNSLVKMASGIEAVSANITKDSSCTAKIYHEGKLIRTIGGLDVIKMEYDPKTASYSGKWPIPWNPGLGEYKAEVTFKAGKKKASGTVSFKIQGRQPLRFPKGFCITDIEPGDSIIKRVPGIGGKTVKVWENYVLWAKYMGADALWHCVGQSQIWNTLNTNEFPWNKATINQVSELGEALHDFGMKYGCWITSFVMPGNRHDLSPYQMTTGYDKANDTLKKMIYISIDDERRHNDIIDLLKKLNANPNVDYVGLDYIRTDFGGLEMVDQFLTDMPVIVPEGFMELPRESRMLWLGKKLEIEKDRSIEEMWQWWRAHKMSTIIKKIKEKAGITKPMWAFTLTWKNGKQHGQDPLMFIDAGLDFNAGMFYSIDKPMYPMLINDWKDYLKQGSTTLMAGQCVDWNLLGKTYEPPGPHEHFIRQEKLVNELLPVNPSLGLFWHDLTRAFMGTRGPYPPIEWATAGAATFTHLRRSEKLFPFTVSWDCPDTVHAAEHFTVEINVTNISRSNSDYYLKLLKMEGVSVPENVTQKFSLAPDEVKTLTFQLSIPKQDPKRGNMFMVPFMLQYGGMSTQERYFEYKYVKVEN